jgi:hypothetical protein
LTTVPDPSREQWPEHVLWRENAAEMYAEQVLDQATDTLYTLAPAAESGSVPYILRATSLRTGRVRRGGSYPVNGLAFASGYLWLYGTTGPIKHPVPMLAGVDPRTLATVRSVKLSGVLDDQPPYWQVAAVTAGPAGSVWVGATGALIRVSARTGTVLGRAVVPAGLELDDLADGSYLYAAAQRKQPAFGAVVLEYSAGTGRLLARTGASPLNFSLAGAELTSVPGGVWASFRTGMNGTSVLLSAPSLQLHTWPTIQATLYGWTMGSSASYGGGALWVMTDDGVRACVNPATGRAWAEVTATPGQPALVLGADKATGQVTAVILGDYSATVVSISPPRTCWR